MIHLHQKVLANNLRVIIAENHKAPVINVTVAYKVGSKDESAAHTGLAHLFEHLMFDNIEGDHNSKFDVYLTEAGGESNAYTTYDYTLYHLSLPSTHTELGVWLESQRMAKFVVPQLALDTQINVVSEEILQTVKNQPYGTWRELQAAKAFTPDCSYSWEVIGTREHVQATSYADAQAWYNRFYRPGNACLVLSGDISAEEGFALAEKYFADIPDSPTPPTRNSFSPAQRTSGYIRDTQQVPHNAVFLSYHADGFINEATLAADIVSSVMNDGHSSRLYSALMYDKQIASGVGCFADKREHSSFLTFYAFANNESISCEQLTEALDIEISSLLRDGISEQELHKARNKLQTSVAYELQTSTGVADAVANQVLFWNDPIRVNTLIERYNTISPTIVHDFIHDTFRQEHRVQVDVASAPDIV